MCLYGPWTRDHLHSVNWPCGRLREQLSMELITDWQILVTKKIKICWKCQLCKQYKTLAVMKWIAIWAGEMTTAWNWCEIWVWVIFLKVPRWCSWPFGVDNPRSCAFTYLIGMVRKPLPIYSIYSLRDTPLYQTIFFSSFSEDRREYNKIKQSKFECEAFGLDLRRNFQKAGGWVLKCIISGIACHLIFWVFHKGELPSAFDMFLTESLHDIGL